MAFSKFPVLRHLFCCCMRNSSASRNAKKRYEVTLSLLQCDIPKQQVVPTTVHGLMQVVKRRNVVRDDSIGCFDYWKSTKIRKCLFTPQHDLPNQYPCQRRLNHPIRDAVDD
jgi:hypothetical protein